MNYFFLSFMLLLFLVLFIHKIYSLNSLLVSLCVTTCYLLDQLGQSILFFLYFFSNSIYLCRFIFIMYIIFIISKKVLTFSIRKAFCRLIVSLFISIKSLFFTLKDNFSVYRILSWCFYCFNILNIKIHSLLAYMVTEDKCNSFLNFRFGVHM